MATKGYPTQKKLSNPISGVTDKITKDQYQTYQPSYSDKIAGDVVPQGLFRLSSLLEVTAASTIAPKRAFTMTSHGGSVGDVVRFQPTNAANPGFEAMILEVPDANTIVLGAETPNNIATGDDFFILRYITPRLDSSGSPEITAASGPIQYVLNGVDTEVSQDTATPANSTPLPVQYLNSSGVRTNVSTLAEQQSQTAILTTIDTDTGVLAGGVTGSRYQTNLSQVGGTAVSVNSGNLDNGTQRVTIAANNPPVGTNFQQIKAQTIATNSGNSDDGTQRVILAANQDPIPATQSGSWSVAATQSGTWNINTVTTVSAVTAITNALPAGTNNIGDVDVLSLPANASVNLNQVAGTTTSVSSGPVGNGVQRVTEANVASATLANVASSASSVTLLASSSTRMGAAFFNDSTQVLYLKFGATASATSYTVQLQAGAYYELPQPCYSGIIDGIWASANGNCRVTSW